jgi:hypothetical protein
MPELQVGQERVGITFESLFWFTVLTAIGTIIGGIAYAYIQNYLPNLPTNATTQSTKKSVMS